MKNAEWVKVDGCGHAIHVEHPEKFGTIVNGFLSEKEHDHTCYKLKYQMK